MTAEPPDAPDPNATALGNLYRGLVAQWIHQDRLLWSRTQLVVAVQGAVAAAAYWSYDRNALFLAIGTLLSGATLTACILRLIILDRRDRNLVTPMLRWCGRQLARCCGRQESMEPILQREDLMAAFTLHTGPRYFSGGQIARYTALAFVVVDVAAAILVAAP